MVELQRLIKFLFGGNEGTADDDTLATQILGRTMNHNICTQLQGTLKIKTVEGIVHHKNEVMGLSQEGDRFRAWLGQCDLLPLPLGLRNSALT